MWQYVTCVATSGFPRSRVRPSVPARSAVALFGIKVDSMDERGRHEVKKSRGQSIIGSVRPKGSWMEHIEFAVRTSKRTDIKKRLAGQFYTPIPICEQLVDSLLARYVQTPRVLADPFCGDGRLVEAWLRAASARSPHALSHLETILLWDYDENAVTSAKANIISVLRDLGLSHCSIQTDVCDTFARAQNHPNTIDLILTNPPWDLLKPDSRDAVPLGHYDQYITSIRSFAQRLADAYPAATSANGKGMAGYEVNLARAGLLVCTNLLRDNGKIGIVLPAAIFCDQASSPFRRELFNTTAISELNYFPAETRAFVGVDQPFVTLCASKGDRSTRLQLCRRNNDLSSDEVRELELSPDNGEPLPLSLGGVQSEIVCSLATRHPSLRMLEMDMRFGLWLGRELDETRIGEVFSAKGTPFLKGRQLGRFEVFEHDAPRINPALRTIPATVNERRLAWRDVSRQNQKRRVQAALVPDGWVTGNSLGVAYFRYGIENHVLALLGVLNSLVFELQVRSRLLTAHVSLGAMRDCAVPFSVFEDSSVGSEIICRVRDCIKQPSNLKLAARLEVAVARAYGIERAQFAAILEGFPKIDANERAMLLHEGWS